MRNAEEFDALYARTRGRLLHQTYALTGDLPAAQSAVRTTYVEAWHHWRKVSRLDDPESWLRPRAWAHAQRRASARWWHREKNVDAEVAATLEALHELSGPQRRMLVLTHLVHGSLPALAREAALPQDVAERELQLATSAYSQHRDVAPAAIQQTLHPLADAAAAQRWPRGSIVRRAGTSRRRSHLAAGALAAGVAVVVSGLVVTDPSGAGSTLSQPPSHPSPTAQTPSGSATPAPVAEPDALDPDGLLAAEQLARLTPRGRWRAAATDDASRIPCRASQRTEPSGDTALVRTFQGPGRAATRTVAVQSNELSPTRRAARDSYDTALGWYAGCTEQRVQLMDTYEVPGVGDEATLFVLRSWGGRRDRTSAIGVARSGQVVTTTAVTSPGPRVAPAATQATLLAAAVNRLCGQPGTGTCAAPPRAQSVPPLAVGVAPGLLSEVDLPRAVGVTAPWVGTEPRRVTRADVAVTCDNTGFVGKGISSGLTRSFLVQQRGVAPTFGLTQTVAVMRVPQARRFVADVRSRVRACDRRNLGTDAAQLVTESGPARDLTVWRLVIEVSDERTVPVLMAIARDRTAVTQLTFIPSGTKSFGPAGFEWVARRALDRLPHMPPPRTA